NERSDDLSHYEFSFNCCNTPHDPLCDKAGSAYTDYVYLNGRLKLKMSGTNSYWYVDDALGSTRLVYKASTKVFSVTTYKPFGIAYGASGAEKFTFAGEMMDSPSGLFYLFARYYDPNIGGIFELIIFFPLIRLNLCAE
ncbi:MAG TPA: hypothetical protein VMW02_01500, partial [Thermoplasmata archaeon]|nr:hypothetical protein [Thermoplasmata archaeon]